MRRAGTVSLLLGCLLVAGCAAKETRLYTMPAARSAPATWMGRSVDDVVDAWGAPTARLSDGEGGTLLVYEDKKVVVSTTVSEGAPTPPDLDPHSPPVPTKTEDIKRVKGKFWIDPGGKVYRFWFSPEVYKKGLLDTPPEKKPAKEESEEPAGSGGS